MAFVELGCCREEPSFLEAVLENYSSVDYYLFVLLPGAVVSLLFVSIPFDAVIG